MLLREKILLVATLAAVAALVTYKSISFLDRGAALEPFRGVVVTKHASGEVASRHGGGVRWELILRGPEGKPIRAEVPNWVFLRVKPGDPVVRTADGTYSFPPSRSPRDLK